MELTTTRRRWRRAWRPIAGIAAAGALVGGLATPASATGGSYFSEYSDATWQTSYDASGSGAIRKFSASVRVSGGEEKPANAATSYVFDASVQASVCVEGGSDDVLVTVAGTASAKGTNVRGVDIKARAGDADVNRPATLNGSVTYARAGQNCVAPRSPQSTPISVDVRFDVDWDNRSGSVPVTYSGDDCGGTGTCYYRDATASGTIGLGMRGWPAFDLGRTSTNNTWLWEGVYPPAV